MIDELSLWYIPQTREYIEWEYGWEDDGHTHPYWCPVCLN